MNNDGKTLHEDTVMSEQCISAPLSFRLRPLKKLFANPSRRPATVLSQQIADGARDGLIPGREGMLDNDRTAKYENSASKELWTPPCRSRDQPPSEGDKFAISLAWAALTCERLRGQVPHQDLVLGQLIKR